MPLIAQLIMYIVMFILSLTAYIMLRYMRKHPPRNDNGTQKA
jgi:cytochrome bd-type quinol oxidase subunit 1